jgi:glycosyltransferase involved in cell wall biosynthesis
MNKPFFTIIVPTYNRAGLISKTIDSISQQRYPNFEIIIVDDGSTDNTETIVKPLLQENIHYVKKENSERAAARNFGTKLAKGDYISWFDSDDIMLPNHLEEALAMLIQHPGTEIFALSFSIATSALTTLRQVILPGPSCNGDMYKQNILACNPVFVRKDIALQFPFDETRALSASEDYELWLRLAANFTIYTSPVLTSTLIEHNERSVNVALPQQQIINRFETFLQIVLNNAQIVQFLNNKKANFVARNYLLIATTIAVQRYKKDSVGYFFKALNTYPLIILQRQFYVFIKVILLHW